MSAILTARSMRREYGEVDAVGRSLAYRSTYYPDAWGYRHWTIVVDLLRGDATEAAVLLLEPPGADWPRPRRDDEEPFPGQPTDLPTSRATGVPTPLQRRRRARLVEIPAAQPSGEQLSLFGEST